MGLSLQKTSYALFGITFDPIFSLPNALPPWYLWNLKL